MKWPEIAAVLTVLGTVIVVLGTVVAMWSQLDSKIETRIGTLDTKFDTKFDALNKLLTDNLLEMKGDIGELKGQARIPTQL